MSENKYRKTVEDLIDMALSSRPLTVDDRVLLHKKAKEAGLSTQEFEEMLLKKISRN